MHPSARKLLCRVITTFVRPGSARPIDSNVLRPITTGWPEVIALKRRRSSLMCQIRLLPDPMIPLRAMATIIESILSVCLYRMVR